MGNPLRGIISMRRFILGPDAIWGPAFSASIKARALGVGRRRSGSRPGAPTLSVSSPALSGSGSGALYGARTPTLSGSGRSLGCGPAFCGSPSIIRSAGPQLYSYITYQDYFLYIFISSHYFLYLIFFYIRFLERSILIYIIKNLSNLIFIDIS